MQKYPKSVVRVFEKANATFRFENVNGKPTVKLSDRDTGREFADITGSDEMDALHKAAAIAEGRPRRLSSEELERQVAAANAKIESLQAKIEAAEKPKPAAKAVVSKQAGDKQG